MGTVHINCVYGEDNIEHIERCLIPALRTATRMTVHLRTMNYNPDSSLRINSFSDEALVIEDVRNTFGENAGFAQSHNYLFDYANPEDYFIIINPDCIPMQGSIDALVARKASTCGRIALVEGRQWPFEHPKSYDPLTLDTPWASGAFCLIDAAFYREIGGMDDIYFLYLEDVDVSWQAWLNGYRVLYESKAVAAHFSGGPFYRSDLVSREERYSLRNFLLLARKFFGQSGEETAIRFLKNHHDQPAVDVAISEYRQLEARICQKYSGKRHPNVQILGICQFSELRDV